MEISRKKSPRAPSIALEEALKRTLDAYEQIHTEAVSSEVIAKNLGYRSANNGSALAAMASLRYYGLLERPKEGVLAVSKAVERYKFSSDEAQRKLLLCQFLLNPPLFAELLSMYPEGLPSGTTIRYELISRGFLPQPAETCTAAFCKSVEFADYFHSSQKAVAANVEYRADRGQENAREEALAPTPFPETTRPALPLPLRDENAQIRTEDSIPVRLTGGRRAWLVVPDRLHEADKIRLKAQIDLLLTTEEEQRLASPGIAPTR